MHPITSDRLRAELSYPFDERESDFSLMSRVQTVLIEMIRTERIVQTEEMTVQMLASIIEGESSEAEIEEQLFQLIAELAERAVEGQELDYERNAFATFRTAIALPENRDQREIFRRWTYWCYADFLATDHSFENSSASLMHLLNRNTLSMHQSGHRLHDAYIHALRILPNRRNMSRDYRLKEDRQLIEALIHFDQTLHHLLWAVLSVHQQASEDDSFLTDIEDLMRMLHTEGLPYQLSNAEKGHLDQIAEGMKEALRIGCASGFVKNEDVDNREPWLFLYLVSKGVWTGLNSSLENLGESTAEKIYGKTKSQLISLKSELQTLPDATIDFFIKRISPHFNGDKNPVLIELKPLLNRFNAVIYHCQRNSMIINYFEEIFRPSETE